MSAVKLLTPMRKYRELFDRLKIVIKKRDPDSEVVVLQRRKERHMYTALGCYGMRAIEVDYMLLWTGVKGFDVEGQRGVRRTFGMGIDYLATTAKKRWSWTTKVVDCDKKKGSDWSPYEKREDSVLELRGGALNTLGVDLKRLVRALEDEALLPGKGVLEVVLHLCNGASGGLVKSLGDVVEQAKEGRERRKEEVVREMEAVHGRYVTAMSGLQEREREEWLRVPALVREAHEKLKAKEDALRRELEDLEKSVRQLEESDSLLAAYKRGHGNWHVQDANRRSVKAEHEEQLKQLIQEAVNYPARKGGA